jgi:hypothetical protein
LVQRQTPKIVPKSVRRTIGSRPLRKCGLISTSFVVPHDFGTYGEVVCEFNDSDEEGGDYAANIENGCDEWDEEAKKELGLIT